ncbi:MAG TPA: DNA gyrase modulator, partial [Acidimicrobiales bacterium]|nr:DNA gyrase modulator [Acidimicrobiales bacterium]
MTGAPGPAGPAELDELPLERLRSAALERAAALGASHAEVRIERIRSQFVTMRDAVLETTVDDTELGMGLRVVRDGSVGFAATVALDSDAAAALADQALELAAATSGALGRPVELAPEPAHGVVTWSSPFRLDPAAVPVQDKAGLLAEWSGRLLAAPGIDHVMARVLAVVEDKHFADLAGTVATQRRVRIHPVVEAVAVDAASGSFESLRTLAPPVGRGWEYLEGPPGDEGAWDWDAELAALPGLLAEKAAAPSVEAGSYDLVID